MHLKIKCKLKSNSYLKLPEMKEKLMTSVMKHCLYLSRKD